MQASRSRIPHTLIPFPFVVDFERKSSSPWKPFPIRQKRPTTHIRLFCNSCHSRVITTQTKLDELSTRDQAETSALTVIVIFLLSADKIDFVARRDISWWSFTLEFGAYGILLHSFGKVNTKKPQSDTMAVAAAQKSREMFAINKSYSIEVIIITAVS